MASSSSDPRPKRPRHGDVAAVIASTGLQIATQAREHGITRHSASKELHQHDSVVTPFGPLYTTLEIAVPGSAPIVVDCTNPFAFLWYSASLSPEAGKFFQTWLSGKICRIAFYNDNVTPGNVLRPDRGRTFEAIYWTFIEFPAWFRSKASSSWFVFAMVESTKLDDVPGALPALAKASILKFFPQDDTSFNFKTTGVLLDVSGVSVHVRAEFGCLLADEKAIKEIVSCKGASGTKPCVSCKNVVGRTEPDVAGYLVHYSCPDPGRFDRQTPASLSIMVNDLLDKHGSVPQREFAFLEQAYGIVFDTGALIFDEYTRSLTRMPDTIFWDWMHCLLASGGVGQYEVNQVVREIVKEGIAVSQLDEFCSSVQVPSSRARLTKTFFKDRLVNKDDAHIRAFASEVLSAITVLGIFMDVVIKPMGKMPVHCACFDRLREIVNMLSRGDEVCTCIPELRDVVGAHHIAFVALYPQCVKPKIHYLWHTVDRIDEFQCNLSCFGPERRHRDAKRIASYSYNKAS